MAEHRLRLGDSVARWLPGLVPNGRHITIRELLRHTSGLFDYADDAGFERASRADLARVWRPRELVRIAMKHCPLFKPGTSWAYSNTDYILLGLVIEAVTGKPLRQELRTRIFRPLRLDAPRSRSPARRCPGPTPTAMSSAPGA